MSAHASRVFYNDQLVWTLDVFCARCDLDTRAALVVGHGPVCCRACGRPLYIDPANTVFARPPRR